MGSKEMRYPPLESLGDFEFDIKGFQNDPNSKYFVNMNTGVDTELNRVYEGPVKQKLNHILYYLSKEMKIE